MPRHLLHLHDAVLGSFGVINIWTTYLYLVYASIYHESSYLPEAVGREPANREDVDEHDRAHPQRVLRDEGLDAHRRVRSVLASSLRAARYTV